MVDLTELGRTPDNGQRTDMNEGGSLYISAFGTKIREKKTVSLVNAKFSEISTKSTPQICQNRKIRGYFGSKSGSLRRKKNPLEPARLLSTIFFF